MSSYLFNILTADLEEDLRKGGWGGVKLGENKVYSLTYADDVVILARDERSMKSMMARLERYAGKNWS